MVDQRPAQLLALFFVCGLLLTAGAGFAAAQDATATAILPHPPIAGSDSAAVPGSNGEPTREGEPIREPVRQTAFCERGGPAVTRAQIGAASVFVAGNAALYRYFQQAWWSGERAEKFFFRADWDEDFRDQDKFGHMLGGYHLTRYGYWLLRDACVSRGKAIAWAAAYATLFQLQIEIWDGKYEKYGFSYPDVLANAAGTALAAAQQLRPELKAIKPTISYARSAAMRNRRNIPGEMRASLDYSGQTYWFSADVNALLPEAARPYWPDFLRLSAGHSITEWVDPQTGATFRGRRQLLLSIDLDAQKLPGENRFWQSIKRQLSYIHFPSPALQITPSFEVLSWYR